MAGGGGISARNKAKTIWQLTVSCGKGPDGKPIQVRETFYGSKLDAKARLAGLVSEVNRRSYLLSGDPTFTDFAAEFMKNYAATNLQPRTIDAYTDRLRRLFPAFGHLKLSRISPSKIAAFYAALAKEVSPDYVHKHHQALHAILEKAVQWEKLESNPTRKVDTPPLPDIEAFSLNADQLDALVEAVVTSEPLQTQAIVLIPLETTAGAGELMGLEWSMVNFDTNEIEICQSAQTQKGKGLVVKRVKNKYRWRIVKVQPWVMAILRKYKVEQQAMRLEMGNLWTGGDFVFTNKRGAPMSPELANERLGEVIANHNLTEIGIHGLRHSSISMMIAQGADIVSVSRAAGHESPRTTLKIYAHLFRQTDDGLAQKRATALKPPTLKSQNPNPEKND